MKNSIVSSALRACCFMLLSFALVMGTGTATFGQSKSDLKAEFQNALSKLPDANTTRKLSYGTRTKINNTRALYQQGLNIESMSQSQTESFVSALTANNTALAAGDPSCVQQCAIEQTQCVTDRCGNNTSFPCWCCIPCNLIMELCLFDCLVDIEIGVKLGAKQVAE